MAEIAELKREKVEFLAKEARSMARIIELEQSIKESAENKKLRDTELNEGNAKRDAEITELRSKIAKLEYIIEENRLKISRSEENCNKTITNEQDIPPTEEILPTSSENNFDCTSSTEDSEQNPNIAL
ncbi:10395_t:CDS:2 [Racocetra fulgida]|uniref:10395_t:CDS:1 n=1 Tax=Racocetra fulgida TaxID=60492 RepID=A0A9N9DLL8_9GLOM|nr:10395_t:CDS:2 [Racocetra fulgida]